MSDILNQLYATIESRKSSAPAGSYTAKLFAAGEDEIVKKIGEEAIEVIVAAKGQGDARIVSEMADLMYHAFVLLASRGIAWRAVEDELARRFK
ncbi:phosphoribosyl-ATP pyrophosphohydrolase [Anaerolineae bacterium]|nr:phosphoribosyl-ATP pyrophosphohydrolase [Anaerolineae bacterium]